MRILIVGAGAVGALYGAMLQKVGGKLSIYCRSDCKDLQKSGIRVQSIWGNTNLVVERTFAPGESAEEPFDLILVATKVLPGNTVARDLTPFVDRDSTILLIQNGLHIEQPFLDTFPENEILSALAFVCSNRIRRDFVEHLDYGLLTIGSNRPGRKNRFDSIVNLFKESGVPVDPSENIIQDRWKKLVWNVPFNPLSVLGGGASTSSILSLPETKELAFQLMEEIIQIAHSEGFSLPPSIARTMMDRTEKMRPYKTSMLLDFEAGRPMEIEAIVGEPLRVGKKHGVFAPRLEQIYALLKLLDENRNDSVS